jgi:hypothetical protein
MKTSDLDKRDYKYILDKPDSGFSPERNKMIIENSIKKMDAMILKKRQEWREGTAERVDAMLTYVQSLRASNKPLEQYFGKRMIAHLRGEEVMDRLYQKRIEANPNKLYTSITKSNLLTV